MKTQKTLWLVDAYNVLRVSLTGDEQRAAPRDAWWGAERRQFLQDLARQLPEPESEVCLVFDAKQLPEAEEADRETRQPDEPLVRSVFAPSADEWIVAAVRARSADDARVRVVTADRPLGNRARSRGAEVVSTEAFIARCRGVAPAGGFTTHKPEGR